MQFFGPPRPFGVLILRGLWLFCVDIESGCPVSTCKSYRTLDFASACKSRIISVHDSHSTDAICPLPLIPLSTRLSTVSVSVQACCVSGELQVPLLQRCCLPRKYKWYSPKLGLFHTSILGQDFIHSYYRIRLRNAFTHPIYLFFNIIPGIWNSSVLKLCFVIFYVLNTYCLFKCFHSLMRLEEITDKVMTMNLIQSM